MNTQGELTFDQQLEKYSGNIGSADISPNKRIPARITFQEHRSRVQIRVYDSNNALLHTAYLKNRELATQPHTVLGEVILEPVHAGIRVTARDQQHHILWGYVASDDTLSHIHTEVATYSTLREIIKDELEKLALHTKSTTDPFIDAQRAIIDLRELLNKLDDCVNVSTREDTAAHRASRIKRIADDAKRMLEEELSQLGPTPGISNNRAKSIAATYISDLALILSETKKPANWPKGEKGSFGFFSASYTDYSLPKFVAVSKKDGTVKEFSNKQNMK